MQILLIADGSTQAPPRNRANERGAALLTVLLFSVLLLAAGGALIMTTALSATNSVDAAAETQAYYAAEAGMQATLAVLRGNVAPNPLFDTSSPSSAANKISFRKAVSFSSSNASGDAATTSNNARTRLSRWLGYNALTNDSRIEISSPYSSLSGMAYDTKVDDPDNSANQTYSTLGSFGSDAPSSSTISYQFGSGNTRVTVWYAPQASTSISSGGTFGTFHITQLNGSPDLCSIDPVKCKFKITIRQVSSSGTIDVPINCTLAYASNEVTVTFSPPSPASNNISGTIYAHTASVSMPSSGSNVSIPVTITPPEPPRLRVTVTGYGPRGAKKQMHMLVSRYAFDYTPSAAITLRGADSASPGGLGIGNSSQYTYTGNDHAGGANLPAFLVTNAVDYVTASALVPSGSTQVTGNPALQQSVPSTLSTFLQTAGEARKLVDGLRTDAQLTHRYFTTASPPSDFGASAPNGLLTFVDGDVDLPPGGGAGTLVVTGTLTMRGSTDFKGVILVLGGGQLLRDGGGNGNTLGSIVVASFAATGGFLAPTFNTNGGGTSDVSFDSDWTRRALSVAGPRVLGVSEY